MSTFTQILVLDDSPAIVDSIEMMMELEGLSVSKFYKGSDMLNALNAQPKPDVILMDMWLSGEDGRDICRTIRADENLRDIPVLIMSASRGLEQSALDAGANDFIAKPFDMGDMITRVRTYIKEN
ncbi:response regulator [uncultured Chryseobacterium sp.]|uniref:response regulator transcription factor n=1 Tax=uncultured Chryseobacterium sp. TaxID=259322 RepID=UPI0025FE6B69|nr:response regulator [uncultured Chryseobacterium sp.]